VAGWSCDHPVPLNAQVSLQAVKLLQAPVPPNRMASPSWGSWTNPAMARRAGETGRFGVRLVQVRSRSPQVRPPQPLPGPFTSPAPNSTTSWSGGKYVTDAYWTDGGERVEVFVYD
jgi:hypothetical protein